MMAGMKSGNKEQYYLWINSEPWSYVVWWYDQVKAADEKKADKKATNEKTVTLQNQ